MTLARVLLTLSGFISVANGLIELGPDTRPAVKAVGVALIVVGLSTWALVGRMRRLGPATVKLTAAVAVGITAARVAQFAVLNAPVVLLAAVLPATALLRVTRSTQEPEPEPSKAVPITAGVLMLLTAAALAFALVPPDLPVSANVPALKDDQSPTTPPEPNPTGYLTASDGTELAYFADVPANPVATLVFFHGSGANAGQDTSTWARNSLSDITSPRTCSTCAATASPGAVGATRPTRTRCSPTRRQRSTSLSKPTRGCSSTSVVTRQAPGWCSTARTASTTRLRATSTSRPTSV